MLNLQASQVETIVRVVLERLRAEQAALQAPASMVQKPGGASDLAVLATSGEIARLDQPLVTLEDLKTVATNRVKTLQVGPRCVVTPAVQDELRRHGIRLQRLSSTQVETAAPLDSLLVFASADRDAALSKPLRALGASLSPVDGAPAATALAQHFQTPEALCVWCSPRPYAAVHAASQIDSAVRSVQLLKIDDLPEAQQQVKPNVLVLNERDWSAASVLRLVQRWIRSRS